MKERVIGFVYQFGNNDYQISLMELTDADDNLAQEIMMRYEDDCTCERGDRNLSLADANIAFFDDEKIEWVVTYTNSYGSINLGFTKASTKMQAVQQFCIDMHWADIKILSCVPTGR